MNTSVTPPRITSLEEYFLHALSSIYDAELCLLTAQNEMFDSGNDALSRLIQSHAAETNAHIVNLEKAFSVLGRQPERITCEVAKGLAAHARRTFESAGDSSAVPAVVASAMLQIEHFEIASYRSLIFTARQTSQAHVLRLLEENLASEENMAQLIEINLPPILERAAVNESDLDFVSTSAIHSLNT